MASPLATVFSWSTLNRRYQLNHRTADAAKTPLNDPAPGHHHKMMRLRLEQNVHRPAQCLSRPTDKGVGVHRIHQQQGAMRCPGGQSAQQRLSRFAVALVGSANEQPQGQARFINQHMSLRPRMRLKPSKPLACLIIGAVLTL